MSELSGTLEGMGLPAIVRFLCGLKKSGCLRVRHENWDGRIFFVDGEVTSAVFGSRRGLPALDALVEALPSARFEFDAEAALTATNDISLTANALLAHLDEVQARTASGAAQLPATDAIPVLLPQPETGDGEEPLQLDRGTLQTLLAVDGHRTVREIITHRGSFDALWQLAKLIEVGMVSVDRAPQVKAVAQTVVMAPRTIPETVQHRAQVRPIGVESMGPPAEAARCPKLGFEDDPSSSFGRPTRLHRCFAAGTPLPLSLDQQRELCVTDQFGTCPRLAMASGAVTSARTENRVAPPAPPLKAEADDPRVVRLSVFGRGAAASRDAAADRQAVGGLEAARARSAISAPAEVAARPTPLRTGIDRTPTEPGPRSTDLPTKPAADDLAPRPAVLLDALGARRLLGIPLQLIAGGAVLVIVLVALGLVLLPQTGDLSSDQPIDDELGALPNASALAAGTPIAQLTTARATLAARATVGAASATLAATPATDPLSSSAASNTSAPIAAVQATLPPEPTAAAATPTVALGTTILDERFENNARNWPSSTQGTAVLTSGSYRLIPRTAGQFVLVGAPITTAMQDIIVSATFHKLGGPAGGGYGIIVRDQAATPQNGTAQNGKYYVLEVGDKGEVGIWRRDGDHWVDLLPWQKADAVKPGSGTNDIVVRAIGNQLSLSVNGTEVATLTDNTLASGLVGLFVGGDGNQVAIDRFTVQTP